MKRLLLLLSLLIIASCLFALVVHAQTPTPSPTTTASPRATTASSPRTDEIDREVLRLYQQMKEAEESRKGELLERAAMIEAAGRPSQLRPAHGSQSLTSAETQLGWAVLVFGIVAMGLQVAIMWKLSKGWGTQSIRIVGLTLVVMSGLFLIVTGYSQEQIAPMIGLLGTITGFLLGKTSTKDSE